MGNVKAKKAKKAKKAAQWRALADFHSVGEPACKSLFA